MVAFLVIGLITDVFDGIIARKLNMATSSLRRLDSGVDQIFFIASGLAVYIVCPQFFSMNAAKVIVLLSIEGITYVVSFVKFKKEIATHSWGAKFWTLTLVWTLAQLVLTCEASLAFEFCFWIGLLTRLEIIVIVLTLKVWTNDVPSAYHAVKLRQGKPIRRYKLFN